MATRITDSTLVSKFAPVPRSVSGGEPGFISIHYRIFWLPKNIGGGGGWCLRPWSGWAHLLNTRLIWKCETVSYLQDEFQPCFSVFQLRLKITMIPWEKKSNSKKIYFVLSEILQWGPSWLLISVFLFIKFYLNNFQGIFNSNFIKIVDLHHSCILFLGVPQFVCSFRSSSTFWCGLID